MVAEETRGGVRGELRGEPGFAPLAELAGSVIAILRVSFPLRGKKRVSR